MASPAVPARSLATLRLLQASCGLLTAASLIALGSPAPGIAAHDGAATVASAHPAVPTEWSGGGPLAIPTIGVVPPGADDWFDPDAEPAFRAHPALPTAISLPTSTEAPATDTDQPATDTPERSSPAEPPAAATQAPTAEAPQSSSPTPTTTSPDATQSRTLSPDATSLGTTSPNATSPETTASPSTTTPDATPSATPTRPAPQTNGRGNVVLALGDELTVFDGETGAVALAIAVDSVDADVLCTGPAHPAPTNGDLVAVLVRVTTGPDLSAVGGEPTVRAADFQFLAPDGGTLVGAGTPSAAGCVPEADRFPADPMTAGQVLSGVVVLDVPATTGTLVFAPDFLPVGAEWHYGPPAAE